MAEITVIVADDHPVFRKGLTDILRADGGVHVVGEASDGEAALQLIERVRPSVALLDIDMPKRNGFEVAQAIRDRGYQTGIAFLTMHTEADLLHRALAAGARGYVLKESAASDILACVNVVAVGRTYISAGMSHHLVTDAAPVRSAVPGIDELSPAEREVLRLISQGLSTKEIAARLSITSKTVENHRSHICAKVGVTGTNALLRFALEHRDHLAATDPKRR